MTVATSRARRLHVLPQTRLGRVSAWLALGFAAFFVVNQAIVVANEPAPEGAARLGLIAFGLGGMALGFVAGVVALVAIVRDRERGTLVFLVLLPALLVVAFVIGEIFLPH